jgi:hypothetical protein
MFCVEETPERSRERKSGQSVAYHVVLHLGYEIADGALLRRTLRYQREAAPQRLALIGNEAHALKFEPVFEQTLQLHSVGLVVDPRKRAEWNLVLSKV